MKTVQAHLKPKSNADQELKKVAEINPQLVLVFGAHEAFAKGGVANEITKYFGSSLVIGCSTAGEIANGGVYDNSVVVTGTRFENPQFRPAWCEIKTMAETEEAGRAFAMKLEKKDLKAIFLLGRGLEINGSALIQGVRDIVGPDVVITGGLAGDGGRFQQTFTLLNGEISDSRIVGFGIYGDSVSISYGSLGGWEPFGPIRRVTRSKQNVLYELDGKPALEIYKKYLGDKAKELPSSGLLFPFALLKDNQDNSGIIRTILAVDEKEQSVTFAGDIPMNGLVRLMHANNDGIIGGAKGAAELAAQSAPAADKNALGILISCVGRKLVLGADVDEELDAVKNVFGNGTVTGFYSYGEICPQSGFSECKLHNQTMTITYLTEKKAA